MSRFGTGLSRLLHIAVLLGLGLVGFGILVGLVGAAMALVDPAGLGEVRATVNGRPVSLREPERALGLAVTMVAALAFAGAVLWQLLGLLKSAARGAPFVADNVRRLRMLAALFATLMVVQAAAPFLPATFGDVLNMREVRLDVGPLFSALMALVLAEVFRVGVALREDAEGTV